MKKTILLAGVCLALLVSCASAPQVTRVDADTATDLSGYWNDTDVRKVCDTLLKDALSSPRVDSYVADFSRRNRGENPTVVVGRFRNNSSEHIDTQVISGIMRTTIINSGRLDFVEGGEAREELRVERQEQQVNASEATAAALGNETGADLMLTGVVKCIVDQAGGTSTRSYFVTATLTNVETNRILWEGENNEIKKVIVRPKNKL
jgi:uncharacterized protein (TIGR02722 family)